MCSIEPDAEPRWQVVPGDHPVSGSVPGDIKARSPVPETRSDVAPSDATGAQSHDFLLVDDEQLDAQITAVFVTPDGAEGGHKTFPCVPDYGMLWRAARDCVPAQRRISIRMDGELLSNANARRLICATALGPEGRAAPVGAASVVLHVDFEDGAALRSARPQAIAAAGGVGSEKTSARGPALALLLFSVVLCGMRGASRRDVYGAMVSASRGVGGLLKQAGDGRCDGTPAVKPDSWDSAAVGSSVQRGGSQPGEAAGRLRSVHVTKGSFLDSVRFTTHDGSSSKLGNPLLGDSHPPLLLEAGERVVAVRGRQASHYLAAGITIETSFGRLYEAHGSCYDGEARRGCRASSPDEFAFRAPEGAEIVGLQYDGRYIAGVLLPGDAKLVSVHATRGRGLDSITFKAWNGATFKYGTPSESVSNASDTFVLERGERVTAVRGRQHDNHLAAGIALVTSKGRLFEAHGSTFNNSGGREFAFAASGRDEIVGLQFDGSNIHGVMLAGPDRTPR